MAVNRTVTYDLRLELSLSVNVDVLVLKDVCSLSGRCRRRIAHLPLYRNYGCADPLAPPAPAPAKKASIHGIINHLRFATV